ncbi:MAG: lytic polysaccharide monooxygenase [Polyangiaceae bacterium]|nr:lytic polysaccharide monooxygenase [Polyangiaceae bacterium]
MRRLLIGSLTFAAAISAGAVTQAHIELMYPPPRHPLDLKVGPCGVANDSRGDNITYLEPGAAITVTWDETIDHPGHYRIMFAEDGSDFPVPAAFDDSCTPGDVTNGVHCLADPIEDLPNGPSYTHDVTLPDIECQNCTLQLIQMMTDKAPYGDGNDIYYSCADLVLGAGAGGSGAGTTSSSGTTSSGGGGGAGAGSGGGHGIHLGPGAGDDGGCGCRAGGGERGGAAAAAAALGLLALASRRRPSWA